VRRQRSSAWARASAGSADTDSATAGWATTAGSGTDAVTPAPTPAPPPPALSCGATAITGNHGHALTIPAADVNSPIDIVYSIMGAADHNHFVTLTAAQLAQIKGKTSATTMSTMAADGHTHLVTVNCA
jgi:hypothetical protein